MALVFTKLKRVLGGQKQAIKAENINDIVRAVEELQNALSPASKKGKRPAAGNPPPFWTTISRVPNSDPAEYQVSVTLGYLTYQQATLEEDTDKSVGWIAPKINDVSLEPPSANDTPTDPPWLPPTLELPDVQSWVYLRVKTDEHGAPKLDGESVTIEAFDTEQDDVHHVRPSPSGGSQEGDYFFLILETEGNGGTPEIPIVRRRITGNRHMPNQLVEIANLQEETEDGEVRELYEGYLPGPDDKHQIRTLVQIEAEGEPIIKPIPTGEDPPKSVRFKRVKPNASKGPQINISTQDDGDTIQVEGNGQNLAYRDPFGGGVDFEDGLATLLVEPEEGAGGANFNIQLLNVKITETDGEIFVSNIGWGSAERFFYVRNGLLLLDDDAANVPIYEVISRIEGESDPSTTGESGPGLTEPDP